MGRDRSEVLIVGVARNIGFVELCSCGLVGEVRVVVGEVSSGEVGEKVAIAINFSTK